MAFKTITALFGLALLAGCNSQANDDQSGPELATESPSPEAPVSILRPDVEQPDLPPSPLEPLNAIIGFPDGGAGLDANAVAALEQVLASEQFATGAPIVLRAHSDSGGTDDANADASQARGLAVAKWLTDNEVDDDRIEVIVFGEQNPAEPNALPDGSSNEAGRAANRRVEVLIVPPAPESEEPASIEAEPDEAESGAVGD